jgi:hypothetical protein
VASYARGHGHLVVSQRTGVRLKSFTFTEGFMKHRRVRLGATLIILAMLTMVSSLAYAQGGAASASLSGTVVDSSGGVIPGADVVAKHNATQGETRTVTDATGKFLINALNPGTYTVTISLMGFKSVVLPDVTITAGVSAAVKNVVMEVGKLEESVVVTGSTEIVQTQSSTVATTLTTKQITNVPLPTRNTLDFVASLPGVTTTGSIRGSTVMGLQASATNITIDGINVQDNYLKSSDGFFARISPRLDAVEDVSVSTANPGAESAGQGAVQIRFATRTGTNKFQGSGYWYYRRTNWDTNYFFNIQANQPREAVKVDTRGFRVGGPVLKDKLFYFFNYEQFDQPGTSPRARTVLTPDAQTGLFTYNGAAAPVNLFTLGAQYGLANNTFDPTIKQLLADVQSTMSKGTTLVTGNPIQLTFNFANPSSQVRRYPTARVDYNVTPKHRVGVSYYLQQYRSFPDTLNSYDPTYPGFPGAGGQNSDRYSVMGNWRWMISSSMVSEVRGGATGGPVLFGDGITSSAFTSSFGNMGGFALGTPLMSSPYRSSSSNSRDAPTYVLEDTISWIKNKHSLGIGASFTQINLNYSYSYYAPTIALGIDANDPANTLNIPVNGVLSPMFSTANFPGANNTDLSNAKSLYALLTGRVTSIGAGAYLNGSTGQYVYNGGSQQLGHERELGFYVQDGWRAKPNLTLNYGLRYELQLPFVALNNFYSRALNYANVFGISGADANGNPNLNQPGVTPGATTQFQVMKKGDTSYKTDYNNFAPSVGAAWRPAVKGGFLKALLSNDPVVRGGYSLSYTREGIQALSGLYSYNPGGSITATRAASLGNLYTDTSQLPILFRNASSLGPPNFPLTPAYPLTGTTNDSVNEFDPNTKTPYVHSFNASFQRTLTKNTALDVRYVGTRMRGGWNIGGRQLNEYDLIESGFLNEFKIAQANLQANITAGKGNTFAYTGALGTNPLPITLAYLTATPSSGAGNTADYTTAYSANNSAFTSSSYLGYLAFRSPSPLNMATALQTGSGNTGLFRNNATSANLPANLFLLNPTLGGVWVTGRPQDSLINNFDAIQLEVRRRLAGGLLVQGSYQYLLRGQSTSLYTVRLPGQLVNTGAPLHQLKVNWVYELPFGQGKHFASGVGRGLNALVGGWSFDGNLRTQSGNRLDFGNVRLIGMTDADLQKAFKLRFANDANGVQRVYMLPQDIIDNTIKAYSTNATSTNGYGVLGAPTGRYFQPVNAPLPDGTSCISGYTGQCTGGPLHHYVTGPAFFRTDVSLAKRIDITKRVWADLRLEVLNVFNNIDFFGTTSLSSATVQSNYEVTSAYKDSSNTNDPGGRLIQLSWRVSW